jgi:uncharacterized membrane protein YgcG
MEPVRIGLLAISGWIVAAVMTVAVSWSAIEVVRGSVVPQTQVSSAALPAPEETVSATTTRPTTAAPIVAAARSISGLGGSVTANCTNGAPTVIRAIPKQGFGADKDNSNREVKFTSSDHETEIHIACSGTTATFTKEEKAIGGGGDDNGGGGDDNGGGSGRGGGGGGGGGDDD